MKTDARPWVYYKITYEPLAQVTLKKYWRKCDDIILSIISLLVLFFSYAEGQLTP